MNAFFRKHSVIVVFISFLIFSILGMWSSGKTNIATPKEIGMTIFSFFQNGTYSITTFFQNTFSSVQQLSALKEDYEKLNLKLQSYEQKQGDIELLQSENDRLKSVLQFTGSMGQRNIPAQIIGKDPGIFFNTITINKGFNQGIKKSMPVIAMQNGRMGLVGKIQAVGPVSSQILPIFDAQNFIAARLENNRFEGLIAGGGSSFSDLTMTYVDPEAKNSIAVGNLVITSGFNSMYPENILVGSITGVESKPYESSLFLKVHPFIEFSRLEFVYVLDAIKEGNIP